MLSDLSRGAKVVKMVTIIKRLDVLISKVEFTRNLSGKGCMF